MPCGLQGNRKCIGHATFLPYGHEIKHGDRNTGQGIHGFECGHMRGAMDALSDDRINQVVRLFNVATTAIIPPRFKIFAEIVSF